MLEPQALSRGTENQRTENQRDDLGHILPQQLWVRTALGLQRCLGAGSRVRLWEGWAVACVGSGRAETSEGEPEILGFIPAHHIHAVTHIPHICTYIHHTHHTYISRGSCPDLVKSW